MPAVSWRSGDPNLYRMLYSDLKVLVNLLLRSDQCVTVDRSDESGGNNFLISSSSPSVSNRRDSLSRLSKKRSGCSTDRGFSESSDKEFVSWSAGCRCSLCKFWYFRRGNDFFLGAKLVIPQSKCLRKRFGIEPQIVTVNLLEEITLEIGLRNLETIFESHGFSHR